MSNQTKSNMIISVDIQINNQSIEKVNKCRFLGVILDDKLTWKSHILHYQTTYSKELP